MRKKYGGVICPIITPVNEDETVDEEGLRRLTEYLIDKGIHGILCAGSNGESMALTQAQRDRAIEIVLDQTDGRIPVIAGAMDTSTTRVIENIKKVIKMGGTCVAVTPIFYDRHTSKDETVRHFKRILEKTEIESIFIYDIPTFTGVKLDAATIIEIAELDDRIVGYKDSSGDYTQFLRVVDHFKDTAFSVIEGVTTHAISALLMGADGYVPVLSAVFPELFLAAYDAAMKKDIDLCRRLDHVILKTSDLLGSCINPTASAKYAVSLKGMTHKRVIWPQDMTTDEDERKIRRYVSEIEQELKDLI